MHLAVSLCALPPEGGPIWPNPVTPLRRGARAVPRLTACLLDLGGAASGTLFYNGQLYAYHLVFSRCHVH